MIVRAAALWLLVTACAALPQQHVLQQPDAWPAPAAPSRELPWGELNVIATTDTHGWLMGHAHKSSAAYSGDWGDYASFVRSMKKQARERGVDLLLVDSGDRVDGNGLVDAEPGPEPKGTSMMSLFRQVPYDVLVTGNHELYKYSAALASYEGLATKTDGHYLSSNVNITLDTHSGAESVPLGNRYRKFKTEMGRSVTAFGTLFDFKAHDKGITVQAPSQMVEESWFLKAIRAKPDVFLLVGHMSIQKLDSEWRSVFDAIRRVHATVPILIFGGHHHIRDCLQEDARSMSLAAGRYMETIGWMSVSDLEGTPRFQRRYLDQNRATYAYHGGEDFDTEQGMSITKRLSKVASRFNLTDAFGEAPQSYYLSRYPFTSPKSVMHLMTREVLPAIIKRPDRPHPSYTVLNSGSIRYDILKGPFTRNDQWIILPFDNSFRFVSGVDRTVASKLLYHLNLVGEHTVAAQAHDDEAVVSRAFAEQQAESWRRWTREHGDYEAFSGLTTGYVTYDSCPGRGDDTVHKPYPYSPQPTFVATEFPHHSKRVDVVFFDFIAPDVLAALNALQSTRTYTTEDVHVYVDHVSANTLMETYASKYW